jgi:hypothetical protein
MRLTNSARTIQYVRMWKEFGDGHSEMCAAFGAFAEGNIPAAWTGQARPGGGPEEGERDATVWPRFVGEYWRAPT